MGSCWLKRSLNWEYTSKFHKSPSNADLFNMVYAENQPNFLSVKDVEGDTMLFVS